MMLIRLAFLVQNILQLAQINSHAFEEMKRVTWQIHRDYRSIKLFAKIHRIYDSLPIFGAFN